MKYNKYFKTLDKNGYWIELLMYDYWNITKEYQPEVSHSGHEFDVSTAAIDFIGKRLLIFAKLSKIMPDQVLLTLKHFVESNPWHLYTSDILEKFDQNHQREYKLKKQHKVQSITYPKKSKMCSFI